MDSRVEMTVQELHWGAFGIIISAGKELERSRTELEEKLGYATQKRP